MSDEQTCCRCFLPFHQSEALYLVGDREEVAHHPVRCIERLRAELAARDEQIKLVANERDKWIADAQQYCGNADFWRDEAWLRDEQIAALTAKLETSRQECAAFEHALATACDERDAARRELQHLYCRSARDGECIWEYCPQLRDGEPVSTGRHCPLDTDPLQGREE